MSVCRVPISKLVRNVPAAADNISLRGFVSQPRAFHEPAAKYAIVSLFHPVEKPMHVLRLMAEPRVDFQYPVRPPVQSFPVAANVSVHHASDSPGPIPHSAGVRLPPEPAAVPPSYPSSPCPAPAKNRTFANPEQCLRTSTTNRRPSSPSLAMGQAMPRRMLAAPPVISATDNQVLSHANRLEWSGCMPTAPRLY